MENPSYFSVLTAEVRYDKRLTPLQKLLFSEITSLTNKTNECWATNSYFAKLYGVSERWISLSITKLVTLNYLKVRYENENGSRRYLSLFHLSSRGVELEFKGGRTQVQEGGRTQVLTNNINNNNKNNREENTPQKVQKKGKPLAKDRLNSLGISYSSPDILLNLGDEIISDLCNKYEVSKSQVIFKAKQLDLWRKSNGKTKKDWVATVENAVAKDYGEKKDWIKEAEEKYGITIY